MLEHLLVSQSAKNWEDKMGRLKEGKTVSGKGFLLGDRKATMLN